MKNKSINRTIAEVESFDFTEPREIVQRGIERGWIRFPAESRAVVSVAIKRGWIRLGVASATAALKPGTPAKAVKTRTRCKRR